MRAGVAALALALLAASCGGADEAAIPSTSSSSTTTTMPATTSSVTTTLPTITLAPTTAAPTTTIDPMSVSIICASGNPLLEPDLDGDGEPEQVFIADRDDGQVLHICDGPIVNDRSFDLAYGHWYLAAVDVEPDGTDELFIGARDLHFGRDQLSTTLHLVDVSGDGLVVHADGGLGLGIDIWTGAGCVDVDGDGARELVHYWASDTEDAIERALAAVDPDTEPVVGQGRFTVPADDDTRSLLGAFTCGTEPVDLLDVAPPAAICETGDFSTLVDLDGDGVDDVVAQGDLDHGARLRGRDYGGPSVLACLASGAVDEMGYGGMGEVFGVDVGPDGAPFVWTGGTSANAAFIAPVYWVDDALDFLRDGDGEIIGFTDGFPGADPPNGVISRSGCGDADGDGSLEFVQVSATPSEVLRWERRAWSVTDGIATLAWSDAGTLDLPADGGTWAALEDLTPDDCGYGD